MNRIEDQGDMEIADDQEKPQEHDPSFVGERLIKSQFPYTIKL